MTRNATVLLVVVGWILFLSMKVSTQDSPAALFENRAQAFGFEFVPGTCVQAWEKFGYCSVRQPKDWSPPEIELVRAALAELSANPIGKEMIGRAQARGYRLLSRYALYGEVQGLRFVSKPTTRGTTTRRDGQGIELMDAYFACANARDSFSGDPGYLWTTQMLLHEIFHAVDDLGAVFSDSDEFAQLVGFARRPDGSRFLLARSQAEMTEWKRRPPILSSSRL